MLTPDWLRALREQISRPGVGAAGGKLVSAVAARANGTPVVVLAGGIAEGTNLEALYEKGVTAVMPVTSRPMTLGEAMSGGAEGVRLTATQLFRLAGALKP